MPLPAAAAYRAGLHRSYLPFDLTWRQVTATVFDAETVCSYMRTNSPAGDSETRRQRMTRTDSSPVPDFPGRLRLDGKGVVDISIWEQKDSMTVHLVNLTNPMMMKGPLREVIPLSAQQVSIRAPEGRRVTKVRLLVAGNEVHYREDGGMITLEVPTIGVHEVIALDLAV